jgi:hypothetical protein
MPFDSIAHFTSEQYKASYFWQSHTLRVLIHMNYHSLAHYLRVFMQNLSITNGSSTLTHWPFAAKPQTFSANYWFVDIQNVFLIRLNREGTTVYPGIFLVGCRYEQA